MRNTFHQATVTHEYIGVMINHRETVFIEFCCQQFFCQRHTHRIGNTLTQRTCRGFHARCDMHFRVTCRFGMQLTEVTDFIHIQIVTAQMQQGIMQHGTMAVGQHKAVTVNPARIRRVVTVMTFPQCHGNVCHAHRRARVTGISFLYGIHRQNADCVCHFAECGRLKCRNHDI